MIPEDSREGVPINFQDSADLKDSLQLHVFTKGIYVATIPIGRIPDIGNTATEQAAPSRNVFYLYRLPEDNCPVNHFFYCHLLKRKWSVVRWWNYRLNINIVKATWRVILSINSRASDFPTLCDRETV